MILKNAFEHEFTVNTEEKSEDMMRRAYDKPVVAPTVLEPFLRALCELRVKNIGGIQEKDTLLNALTKRHSDLTLYSVLCLASSDLL